MPLVSYASSSPTLSSKTDYAWFFRTCPSDNQQSQVWVSIMKHYDWRQCAILASNDAYGSGIVSAFQSNATSNGISVSTVAYFSTSETDFSSSLEAIRSTKAKVIMLSALAGSGGRLALKQAAVKGMLGPKSGYTWIIAEGSATRALLLSDSTESEYTLSNADFAAALAGNLGTQPRGGSGDLWDSLIATWKTKSNDTDYPGAPDTSIVSSDVYVPYSVDAAYAIAYAFRKLVLSNTTITGSSMRTALAATSFVGVTGNVAFDSNYDRTVPYYMTNILSNGTFLAVGDWSVNANTSAVTFTVTKTVVWPGGTTTTPGDGLPRTQYWIEWSSATSITILVFVGIAMTICIVTIILIAKLSNTPIMRLASPTFLITTLIGLTMFFSSLVPWMGYPNQASCSLRNWLGHLGFCLALAAIIAKTYRVDVIFRRRKKIKRIIVTNWELAKYVAIIMAPITVLLIIWTIVDRPKVTQIADSDNNRINIACGSGSLAWLVAALVYDAFLMLLSLFLSFRTRRVPDGFNETWYIYLSGYNTLVMGILGVTLGYILKSNLIALTVIISVTLLIGGLVIWALLYLPKLYIGLWQPDRNNSMLRSVRTNRGGVSQYSVNPTSPRSAELAAWGSSNTIYSSHNSSAADNTDDVKGSKSSSKTNGSKNDSKANGSKNDSKEKNSRPEKPSTKEEKKSLTAGAGQKAGDETDDSAPPTNSSAVTSPAISPSGTPSTSPSGPRRKKKGTKKAAKAAKPAPEPEPVAAPAPSHKRPPSRDHSGDVDAESSLSSSHGDPVEEVDAAHLPKNAK